MIRTILAPLIALLILGTAHSAGEVVTENVVYEDEGVVLEGYAAYDDSIKGERPALLVYHQWRGLTDYEKMRARMLAELGYVAFAADVYGKGVRASDDREAGKIASIYRGDRALMRRRARAALDEILGYPLVDGNRVAAIGYCFGGTVALELARSGAPLAGVATFHGGLDTPDAKDALNIQGKVLAMHGAADQAVTPEQVAAFQKEMTDGGVDWYFVTYAYAQHAFTQKGPRYNEAADRRSWDEMKRFLEEVFGK